MLGIGNGVSKSMYSIFCSWNLTGIKSNLNSYEGISVLSQVELLL